MCHLFFLLFLLFLLFFFPLKIKKKGGGLEALSMSVGARPRRARSRGGAPRERPDHHLAGFTVESGFADALYRPRTMQTMFTFFLVSILVLYWHMDVRREAHVSLTPGERDALAQTADVRTGVFIVGLFLMMYFALQSRDGVMHRPHPIIWRCVHGAGVLYVMLRCLLRSRWTAMKAIASCHRVWGMPRSPLQRRTWLTAGSRGAI